MRLGHVFADLRRQGPEIEDAVERDRVHDKLASEGGCCYELDCWEPCSCGSVCGYHSRHQDQEGDDDATFSD